VDLWSMGLVCLKGTVADPACLCWLDRLGGVRCMIKQNEDCVCGSPAWQAFGAQPCRMNIVQRCARLGGMASKAEIVQGWGVWPSETELLQGCAGLGRAWPVGDGKYLWIPGLKGSSHGDPVGLRGESLG
jgi:hypothetical protein